LGLFLTHIQTNRIRRGFDAWHNFPPPKEPSEAAERDRPTNFIAIESRETVRPVRRLGVLRGVFFPVLRAGKGFLR
jgi:hypothetical protein